MTALTPFVYGDRPIRVMTIDGEPWFVLADLARRHGILPDAIREQVAA